MLCGARRTQFLMQLEGAGPVELETVAITAITTEDVVLAAPTVTDVDRRPRNRRPFSVGEFAEHVWSHQHAEVPAKLSGAILTERTACAADNIFILARADPLVNLFNQLAARDIEEATGEVE